MMIINNTFSGFGEVPARAVEANRNRVINGTKNTYAQNDAPAAELRKNQTEAQARLWSRLRAHQVNGVHFRRQYAIGSYIVDFCSPRRKLIIEVDGSQHLERREYDSERTRYLKLKGFRVLRF